MLITDISFLENALDNEKILAGGYSLTITSIASSGGYNSSSSSTKVSLNINGKNKKAKGIVKAVAIGKGADVDIDVKGFNKVKRKAKQAKNYAFETVKLKA
ncbi:MAG TPA: hypothetical protein V6C71_00865 [Coleofasciculaceae cyanobacterium]|jgi:hypothetical protein